MNETRGRPWKSAIAAVWIWCVVACVLLQVLPGFEIGNGWGSFVAYGWPFPAVETGPNGVVVHWRFVALNLLSCGVPLLSTTLFCRRLSRSTLTRTFGIQGLLRFTLLVTLVLFVWQSGNSLYHSVLEKVGPQTTIAAAHWAPEGPPFYLVGVVYLGFGVTFEWCWIVARRVFNREVGRPQGDLIDW